MSEKTNEIEQDFLDLSDTLHLLRKGILIHKNWAYVLMKLENALEDAHNNLINHFDQHGKTTPLEKRIGEACSLARIFTSLSLFYSVNDAKVVEISLYTLLVSFPKTLGEATQDLSAQIILSLERQLQGYCEDFREAIRVMLCNKQSDPATRLLENFILEKHHRLF